MDYLLLLGAAPFVLMVVLFVWDLVRKRRNEARRLRAVAWLGAQLVLARMGRKRNREEDCPFCEKPLSGPGASRCYEVHGWGAGRRKAE